MRPLVGDQLMVTERLDSGVAVTMTPNLGYASTFAIWVTSGSRHESDDQAGGSHLLEHLLLAAKEGGGSVSQKLERMGIEANAFTSKEHTVFITRQPSDLCVEAAKLLSDAVTVPSLTPELLLREKEVILNEIRGNESDSSDYIFELFHGALHAPSAIARPTTGKAHSVRNLSLESVIDLHHRRYHANTIHIFVTGAFSPVDVLAALRSSALNSLEEGGWIPQRHLSQTTEFFPLIQSGMNTEDFCYLMFGCQVPIGDGWKASTWRVVNTMLGGSTSSALYSSVREQEALSYEVWSEVVFFTDRAMWFMFASTPEEELPKLIQAAQRTLFETLTKPVSDEVLEGARNHTATELLIKADPSSGYATQLGEKRATLQFSNWTLDEEYLAIKSVTSEMVEEAFELLRDSSYVIAVTGGSESSLDRFSWNG